MSASASSRPVTRSASRPYAAGLVALLAVALLSGCSDQAASAPTPPAVSASGATGSAESRPASVTITSSVSDLTLVHWGAAELPVALTGGSGPVTLRMERADGHDGDMIEVFPSTMTPGTAPTALKLRLTRVAFPAPEEAARWTLVASQGSKDVASLDLNVSLQLAALSFTAQPVTAAEGQTVDVTLTVDADTHDLPPFTFSLSPYIQEETESYEPARSPSGPATYTVTSLPATFSVPVTFKAFHGDQATKTARFQLTVDGLADTLGSNRYLGKYVRTNLTWSLAR